MKKWIIRILVSVVVLLIVAVGVAWAMVDSIAKTAVVKGGTYATGTTSTIDSLTLSLLKGQLTLNDLVIENPKGPGFAAPFAFKMGRFDLKLTPKSLLSDTVLVQDFAIEGMEVYIEQKGADNNLSIIIKHIQQLGGPKASAPAEPRPTAAPTATPGSPAAPGDEDSKIRIKADRLLIKGVVAHVKTPLPGQAGNITINVPTIEMLNLSTADGKGLTIAEIAGRILPAVVQGVIENGKGLIPADMAALLTTDIAAARQRLGDVTKSITNLKVDANTLKIDANSLPADANLLKSLPKDPLKDLPKNPLKGLLDGNR